MGQIDNFVMVTIGGGFEAGAEGEETGLAHPCVC